MNSFDVVPCHRPWQRVGRQLAIPDYLVAANGIGPPDSSFQDRSDGHRVFDNGDRQKWSIKREPAGRIAGVATILWPLTFSVARRGSRNLCRRCMSIARNASALLIGAVASVPALR
jgi:hypothetical protein